MFKHPVDQCDVLDKPALELFRKKKVEWIEKLHGSDVHSVMNQIWSLTWNDTWFRLFNELVRWNLENSPTHKMNQGMISLLQVGYVIFQSTRIRRLAEPQNSNPSREIVSLKALLDDIKTSGVFITREIYVAHDGLPYDYKKAADEVLSQQIDNEVFWGDIEGPKAFGSSQLAHQYFDKLSGVTPEKRSRYDRIALSFFDECETLLAPCHDIKKYTDKFVAHAAHPKNRSGLSAEQKQTSISKFEQCQKPLYIVVNRLSQSIAHGYFTALSVPQYNHLAGLETTVTSAVGLEVAKEFWKNRHKIIEAWAKEI